MENALLRQQVLQSAVFCAFTAGKLAQAGTMINLPNAVFYTACRSQLFAGGSHIISFKYCFYCPSPIV